MPMRGSPPGPPDRSRMAAASSSASEPRRPYPRIAAINSLSPRPAAPSRTSFSRGRSDSDNRIYFCAMSRFRWYVLFGPALLAIVSLVACGEPPDKEMHQAQGAIDAARAVGAETYAPDEFKAAVDALTRAQDAVAQRDYRLALNNALDSREQAQNAAKMAADGKAAARTEADRAINAAQAEINAVEAKVKTAETGKATRSLDGPRCAIGT